MTKTEQKILEVFAREDVYAITSKIQARTLCRMISEGHDISFIQSPLNYAMQTMYAIKTPMSESVYKRVGGKDIRHVSITRLKKEWEVETQGVA